jgi:hypothetical protein
MSVQQFELDKNRFSEVQKLIIVRGLPVMVLAMLAGFGISYFNNGAQQDQPSFWFIMIPVFLLLLAAGMYRGIQRQKVLFLSYRLTIDEHCITREQATTPTIRLAGKEIQEIYKDANGSYAVKGSSINQTILIPAQIENPAGLEESLARFSPLEASPKMPITTSALRLLPIATLVLMVLVYVSASKVVVAVSGTLLLGVMSYSLVATQRSKHIDGKTKKNTWILLLVIASVLAVMYTKLFALS